MVDLGAGPAAGVGGQRVVDSAGRRERICERALGEMMAVSARKSSSWRWMDRSAFSKKFVFSLLERESSRTHSSDCPDGAVCECCCCGGRHWCACVLEELSYDLN